MSASLSRWRNRTFVVTFAAAALAWLAFVGWVAWDYFPVMMDWVDQRNEFLQELFGLLVVLGWALFLGLGAGAAVELADRVAGTRTRSTDYTPGQTHGQHATWRRPDRS